VPRFNRCDPLRWAAASFGLFLALSQVSCQPPRRSTRLIVASAGKITSLDPAQASTFDALQLLSALGDPLYRLDTKGNLQPRLAADLPQISDNGFTISIPLRKDVLFHDGTRFDAAAMAFSLRRFLRIGTLNYVVGGRIASVETPDPYLLRLRLTRPSTSLEGLLTSINLTPVSPKAYAKYKNQFLNKRFIGTGPYQLTSFQTQQQRLEPFPQYWSKKASNDGIDFINLSNSTALFGALRSGEVDVLLSNSLDEDQRLALHLLAKQGKLREAEGPALEIGYITLLSNSAPLNQPILRQAISHSLDRNLIIKRVSYGLRQPLRSLVPPSLKGETGTPWPSYNPQRARELLQKAGYCSAQKLTLPLTFRSNVPADKLLALTWQAQVKRDLSDCLILKLDSVESTTVYRQLGEGAFQAVILEWLGAYPDPEAYLAPLLSCNKAKGSICEEGEAAISGSFWTAPGLEQALLDSDELHGPKRLHQLKKIERDAAAGAAYLPVWLVAPRAWAQLHLAKPEFDGSGQLQLPLLRERQELTQPQQGRQN